MTTKKIAILVCKRHFRATSGIGNYCKAMYDMYSEKGHIVHFITDMRLDEDESLIKSVPNAVFIHDDNSLDLNNHVKSFFFSETVIIERVLNYRNALLKAMSRNIYDGFILNDIEGLMAIYISGICYVSPCVFYTHLEMALFRKHNAFSKQFESILHLFMNLPNLIIGTQTKENVDEILQHNPNINVKYMPMPIPERGLLKDSDTEEREGVLFITNVDLRKNIKRSYDILEKTGLKGIFLTNKTSARKIQKELLQRGVKNVEIHHTLQGKEKIDVISKAKVFHHSSDGETYSYAVGEALHRCPVVLDENKDWTKYFVEVANLVPDSKIEETILELHNKDNKDEEQRNIEYMRKQDNIVWKSWDTILDKKNYPTSDRTNLAKQLTDSNIIKLSDYYSQRSQISFEDAQSTQKTANMFVVKHVDNDSYICKNADISIPIENEDSDDLMELFE